MRKCAGLVLAQGSSHRTVRQRSSSCVAEGGKRLTIRCKALVSVSGYLIGSQEIGKMPLPPKNELEWWYQYYFATERGRAGYDKYRHDFAKLVWRIASPKWSFNDATFDRNCLWMAASHKCRQL